MTIFFSFKIIVSHTKIIYPALSKIEIRKALGNCLKNTQIFISILAEKELGYYNFEYAALSKTRNILLRYKNYSIPKSKYSFWGLERAG